MFRAGRQVMTSIWTWARPKTVGTGIASAKDTKAIISWNQDDGPHSHECELLDIGGGGVAILMAKVPPRGRLLTIRLHSLDKVSVDGRMVDSHLNRKPGKHLIRIRFIMECPPSLFETRDPWISARLSGSPGPARVLLEVGGEKVDEVGEHGLTGKFLPAVLVFVTEDALDASGSSMALSAASEAGMVDSLARRSSGGKRDIRVRSKRGSLAGRRRKRSSAPRSSS